MHAVALVIVCHCMHVTPHYVTRRVPFCVCLHVPECAHVYLFMDAINVRNN